MIRTINRLKLNGFQSRCCCFADPTRGPFDREHNSGIHRESLENNRNQNTTTRACQLIGKPTPKRSLIDYQRITAINLRMYFE